jgi:hypothetical protein
MHMPLHSGDRGDRGGNDLLLTFHGRRTNLHSLWDSGLFEVAGLQEVELVARITDRIGRRNDLGAMMAGSLEDWANESHDVARDVAYRLLPASLELTSDYSDAVGASADLQLVRASVRLAAVLERALGDGAR